MSATDEQRYLLRLTACHDETYISLLMTEDQAGDFQFLTAAINREAGDDRCRPHASFTAWDAAEPWERGAWQAQQDGANTHSPGGHP